MEHFYKVEIYAILSDARSNVRQTKYFASEEAAEAAAKELIPDCKYLAGMNGNADIFGSIREYRTHNTEQIHPYKQRYFFRFMDGKESSPTNYIVYSWEK